MVETPDDDHVLRLVQAAGEGDRQAADRLLPLVFDQLRKTAGRYLAGEPADHTLTATALVHEAWLKLAGPRQVPWAGHRHYLTAAAEAMRQILVDHARKKAAARRGGPAARRAALELSSLPDPASAAENSGFLILEGAIVRLEQVDPEAAAIVRLRYFTGLTIDETATVLGVSAPTVKRSWAFARGWLKDVIESERD